MNADIRRLHRIVGHHGIGVRQLVRFGVSAVISDKFLVFRVIHRLEVVPRGQVAHQRFGVNPAQFFFAHRERHHRHVGRLQPLVRQFFIERHVGIAVNGGNDGRFTARREFFDIGDNRLVVAVAKRRVDLFDVFVLHAFSMQVRAKDFIGGARIDVIGTEQEEALRAAAILAHQVLHRRDRLLVRRGTCIEDVRRHLFALILHRVEQQPVEFFKDRQHRFTRHRCPAAEHGSDLILAQQLTGFLGEQRPVGGRVNHYRLQLFTENAAFGVDLIDSHQRHIFQRRFRNRHRAGERVHDAHFNGVGGLGAEGEPHADDRGGKGESF